MQVFLDICKTINFPVNLEKTFWVSTQTTFLGFLLDTVSQTISAPHEKIVRGINMIFSIINKKNRKVTVHQMQKICRFLNVLGCAIIPGRAFTCRIYSAINPKLKLHHHLHLNGETLMDLAMWLQFLRHPSCYSRPFMDVTGQSQLVPFYLDASKNARLGMGANCMKSWMVQQWDHDFILTNDSSIEYLELFALTAAILACLDRFRNQ